MRSRRRSTEANASVREGVELIHRQLLDVLRRRGVEPFDVVGQIFDPEWHEAVANEPAERPAGRRDHRGSPARLSARSAAAARRRWSRWPRREPPGLLRSPRRRAARGRAGNQERLPQAGAEVPPRSQPRRQGGRRTLQGSGRGLRRPRRRGEARALRPVRPRRRDRAPAVRDRASTPTSSRTSPTSSATSSGSAAARRAGPSARRRPSLRPRDLVRGVVRGHREHDPDSARRDVRDVQGHARAPGLVSRNVPAVPRHRPAALPAGLPRRRAAVRPVRRDRADRAQSLPHLPRNRTHGHGSARDGQDSGRDRRRPAPPPARRRRARRDSVVRPAISTSSSTSVRIRCSAARRTTSSSKCPCPIPRWRMGGSFKVDGPAGPLDVDVSAGTPSGSVISFRGKGMPSVTGRGRGAFHVRVVVDVPRKLSKDQKKLVDGARPDHAGRDDRGHAARCR